MSEPIENYVAEYFDNFHKLMEYKNWLLAHVAEHYGVDAMYDLEAEITLWSLQLDDVSGEVPGSWRHEMMRVIRYYGHRIFTIGELVHDYGGYFQNRFPNNATIAATMRAVLQRLRDDGHIKFLNDGRYQRA